MLGKDAFFEDAPPFVEMVTEGSTLSFYLLFEFLFKLTEPFQKIVQFTTYQAILMWLVPFPYRLLNTS
jgi:hypothetical protein